MTLVGDKRFIPHRRTKNQLLNYNRRIRVDRRLNNILVEWVPNSEIVLQPSLFKAYYEEQHQEIVLYWTLENGEFVTVRIR